MNNLNESKKLLTELTEKQVEDVSGGVGFWNQAQTYWSIFQMGQGLSCSWGNPYIPGAPSRPWNNISGIGAGCTWRPRY